LRRAPRREPAEALRRFETALAESSLPAAGLVAGGLAFDSWVDRPTREMVVPPFSPKEMAELLGMGPADALDAYLVVGGFPTLATSWSRGWSRRRFLESALAETATHFVVNGERILEAELRSELQARAVLEAIGAGERTYANIRRASGVGNDSSLSGALEALANAKRVVRAALPYAAPPGRKSKRYAVADPYLRFWLRFVRPNIEEIDRGRGDLVTARIEEGWTSYRGQAIEPIGKEGVERLLPHPRLGGARCVGGYWTRGNDVEVDLVGADRAVPQDVAFIGSIKWRERLPFDNRDTRALIEQRASVPGAGNALLLGVSRSGFAQSAGLDLALGPEELVAAWA
jgi:hypothetical protein